MFDIFCFIAYEDFTSIWSNRLLLCIHVIMFCIGEVIIIYIPMFCYNRLLTQAAGIAADLKEAEEVVDLMERAWWALYHLRIHYISCRSEVKNVGPVISGEIMQRYILYV